MDTDKLTAMSRKIETLKSEAEELMKMADDFPAVAKNAKRILACVNMLDADLPGELLSGS